MLAQRASCSVFPVFSTLKQTKIHLGSTQNTMSTTKSNSINLLRGWPSPSLHPTSQLSAAATAVLSTPSVSTPALQYGPDAGYEPLRAQLSKWLSRFYDCPDDVSRICITGGASQNLACALQVFTDPKVTRAVWMVAPCYFLACRIFEDAGFAGRLRSVPEDEEGIDVGYLENEMTKAGKVEMGHALKPKRSWSKTYDHVIYAVPAFSNPSGKTMSLARRHQLVALARDHNALIVTDDVYDYLQWPTDSLNPPGIPVKALLPRLTDVDRALPPHPSDPRHFGHTMGNASFSKILGPGVRTGWVDAMPNLAYGLSQCGSSRSGGCPSQLVACMISEMLKKGQIQEHITNVLIPAYAQRWRKMMSAIEKYLVPLGVVVQNDSLGGKAVFGGYFIWFELPKRLPAGQVASISKEKEDLIVAHGNLFEVYGDEEAAKFDSWLRLCFAWEDEDKLVEGVERLGRVVKGIINGDLVDDKKTSFSGLKAPLGAY